MPQTAEVARQLREFTTAVASKERAYMPPGNRSQPRRTGPAKTRLEQIYEEAVAVLTDAERDELDRMIETMQRALAGPTGRIVPP